MANEERLGLRAYAKRVGSNHATIKDAIKNKRIVGGWDPVAEQIIVSVADVEWGNGYMTKKGVTPMTTPTAERSAAEPVQKPPVLNASVAQDQAPLRPQDVGKEPGAQMSLWDGGDIPNNVTYPEALRITQIQTARLKVMEEQKLKGILVERAAVEQQLLVAGMEIRKVMERFPASIVDAVLGAKTRGDALRVMDDEVGRLLEGLGAAIAAAIKG